jgi:hypothetical protein
MEMAMETTPESFGSVIMLYINCKYDNKLRAESQEIFSYAVLCLGSVFLVSNFVQIQIQIECMVTSFPDPVGSVSFCQIRNSDLHSRPEPADPVPDR